MKLRKSKYSHVNDKDEIDHLIYSFKPKSANLNTHLTQPSISTINIETIQNTLKTENKPMETLTENSTIRFNKMNSTSNLKLINVKSNSNTSNTIFESLSPLKTCSNVKKNCRKSVSNFSIKKEKRAKSIPNNLDQPNREITVEKNNNDKLLKNISINHLLKSHTPLSPTDKNTPINYNVHDCLLVDNYNRLCDTMNYFCKTLEKKKQKPKFYSLIKYDHNKRKEEISKLIYQNQKKLQFANPILNKKLSKN